VEGGCSRCSDQQRDVVKNVTLQASSSASLLTAPHSKEARKRRHTMRLSPAAAAYYRAWRTA